MIRRITFDDDHAGARPGRGRHGGRRGPRHAGEVVVTAQKRAEKLQDVPISMEVVSGEKLDAFHTNDFKRS